MNSNITTVVGIDTDVNGAVAVTTFNHEDKTAYVSIHCVPKTFYIVNKKKRNIVDTHEWANIMSTLFDGVPEDCPKYIYAEQQQAGSAQGVTSMFSFGRTYGALLMGFEIAMHAGGKRPELVRPGKWKRAMGVTSDKKQTVSVASALAPDLKHRWKMVKNTSSAEAFLIALYGFKDLGYDYGGYTFKERA